VAYGVRTAFFDLARAQELRQVAEDAVRQYQAHLEQVKAYAEVGRRIRYDVTKAEVVLGNAQLNQISAANAVATARAVLNRSLGLAEEPGYRLGASEDLPLAGDADALMAAARERHPALRALRAQETFASAAVDETIADLYPSLRLTGQYGASGSRFPLIGNWWGAAQSAWSAFTGWRKTGRVDETAAQLRTARAATASREQQIHLEIRSALSQLDSARQRRQLSDLIVREAQESLNLVSERYRVGQASAVDVTDAQVALTQAQGDRVRARFDCQTAVAQLKHAIGEE
jgi:outer membrane protein